MKINPVRVFELVLFFFVRLGGGQRKRECEGYNKKNRIGVERQPFEAGEYP